MTPDLERRIEDLYQAVLSSEPGDRATVSERADPEVRSAVEKMLDQAGAGVHPDSPAYKSDGSTMLQPSIGSQLGPYRIEAPIGSGGMGVVYRAVDTRLNRAVAIKIPGVALDVRFKMEARSIAALNHPNICTVHDVGPNYLVLELVEGLTLAERIRQGPLPLEEAIAVARQVAAALSAAHESGIVHRDLKPANIKITPAGIVKVLDFGLASTSRPASSNSDAAPMSRSTMTSATTPGAIMGTIGYMSPEQASGKPVDERTDIWAFGVVLWEMVTGERLFGGGSLTEGLTAVLTHEPDWQQVPFRVRRLLRSCLQRDLRHRLRDIGDAGLLLEEGEPAPAEARAVARQPVWWRWIACALSIALIAAIGALWLFTRPVERPPVFVDLELGTNLQVTGRVAISPDGRRVAFFGKIADGKRALLSRRLDQPKAVVLVQDLGEGAPECPFFSPDSKWIGYASGHELEKISVDGGLPVVLADGLVGEGWSSWSDHGDIISVLNFAGLSRIPAAGGAPQLVGIYPYAPSFLPGGKLVLQSMGPLSILPIEGGKPKPIRGISARWAQYIPAGYILYVDRSYVLQALPFDVTRLEATGSPFPVLENVDSFDISSNGTLICRRAKPVSRTVRWVDESGKTEPIVDAPGAYFEPRLSPDGARLAVAQRDGNASQIWIHDLARHSANRITFGDSSSNDPRWMPDGKYLTFLYKDGVYVAAADGSIKPRRLLEVDATAEDISPDGHTLALVREGKNTVRDIWLVPLKGEGETLTAGVPQPFINGPADEINPAFSPDGKWLAYSSSQNGVFAIYVCSLKRPGLNWQASREEGYLPEWSPKRKELLFHPLKRDGLWVASYAVNGDTFVPGPVRLFASKTYFPVNGPRPVFCISPAGNRVAALLNASDDEGTRSPSITMILNALEEIKRRGASSVAR